MRGGAGLCWRLSGFTLGSASKSLTISAFRDVRLAVSIRSSSVLSPVIDKARPQSRCERALSIVRSTEWTLSHSCRFYVISYAFPGDRSGVSRARAFRPGQHIRNFRARSLRHCHGAVKILLNSAALVPPKSKAAHTLFSVG